MRIKPITKPKLIVGGALVVFLVIVGVANAHNNPAPPSDTTDTIPTTVTTAPAATCDPSSYVGVDGLCTPDAQPADTVPADTDTYAAPPADDNDGSSGDGGVYVPHPHVHVCVGHHVRICS